MNRVLPLLVAVSAAGALPVSAQQTDPSRLTVQRIYASPEFVAKPFGPARWLADGAAYTTVEPAADGVGQDLVRYDVEKGSREVLVPASRLVPPGGSEPIHIQDYAWSPDGTQLLVFTNTQPVWRLNTRGDYWVLDRPSGKLRQLGGSEAKPSSLMFAKFAPDGGRVGYVRENNLYVEELANGKIIALTTDGSRTMINGTFDWVYEEELMNYYADGWRWSPDGASIAYWQLNADSVKNFHLVNNTDSIYSRVIPIQYPKVGETNSAARIGVVSAAGGATRWLHIEGDPRNHYIPRMDWAASSGEVILQRLNRLQNRNEVMLGDARSGKVRTILVEQDSTWVDLWDNLVWLDGGKSFTWMSERDGWKHVYAVSRDGSKTRLVTPGDFDVLDIKGIDPKGGWLYYIASPDNPVQRYLFRARLDGKGRPERLTPSRESGTHAYDVAPNYRYAIETYSSLGNPPIIRLVKLPKHQSLRTLVDNQELRSRVSALRRGPVEWLTIEAEDGAKMPGVLLKPAEFDSTRKYPLLFFVYGGPGNTEVNDAWGGYFLWHTMLTQKGYLVAVVDNRGTPAPLGRRFRKVVYGQLGVLETRDQAVAARTLASRSYVDPARIGIWGWSYGGFMVLNSLFQHPDLYRTGVAVSPVTHWSLYDNVYTERYNGLITDNREGYDRGSPLSYVKGLKGSLLLIHGGGDDNVHFQNSEIMINALVAANRPFEMMEYPNRTHCICQGKGTQAHLFDLVTRFLDRNLMGGSPSSARQERAAAGK
ncbi:MAG TPA: DPP IV N-terminal domain-containing protein [Gemmatimonadales bacterium]